jgi:hypothetical protein
MSEIAENIRRVLERISIAADACGRKPEEITLVAVCKTFPAEVVWEAVAAGQTHFGENRVQEAEAKIPQFASCPQLTWHMIGHLQSNKADRAEGLFDIVESVDSVKLAGKLSQAAAEKGKILPVLVQVDLGEEETKFGAARGRLFEIIAEIGNLPGLRLDGLMTIPPYFEEPERTLPFFSELRELRNELQKQQPGCLGRGDLSMGMSHDFEVAIREGATIIRVGTAIFGHR